jgi:hypothetical protein
MDVILRRESVQAVCAAARALPQAGIVALNGQTLRFTGPPRWLGDVQALVFAAELTDPEPIRAR